MAQSVTYRIVDQPDGRFDLIVVLGSRSVYARRGFMTIAEAEEQLESLKILMAACGAPVIQARSHAFQGLNYGCWTN